MSINTPTTQLVHLTSPALIAHRSQLDALQAAAFSTETLWKEVATFARTRGIQDFESADLMEHLDQGDYQVACLVVLSVRVTDKFNLQASLPEDVRSVLDHLAQAVCCDKDNNWIAVPQGEWQVQELDIATA